MTFKGKLAQPEEVGEIMLRGPGIMAGYWQGSVETEIVLKQDWHYSDDTGYLDTEGHLHLTDRIKDMIITGGENVYSLEVENTLLMHPKIVQCAVVGMPCTTWGEIVQAVIVSSISPDHNELDPFFSSTSSPLQMP